MRFRYAAYLVLVFITAIGCDKESDKRMDDFILDFATIDNISGKTYFVLDNYRVLIPTAEPSKSWPMGQRVILNYSILNSNTIKVNSVSEIYTGKIKVRDDVDNISNDPIKVQSVWVGGDHLNLIFNVEYYDQPHSIDLIRNTEVGDNIELYISYSRNNDSPGYSKKMYASFYLGDIQSDNDVLTPFTLLINTETGLRIDSFEVSGSRLQ